MGLRVVGAGLGRTGTYSLKLALERLLGAPCYHMAEIFQRPQDIPIWHAAANGERVDWHALFADYAAAVDWPPAAFWPQIADAFPDAIIVLSVRDAAGWWKSASSTILATYQRGPKPDDHPGWRDMRRWRGTSESSCAVLSTGVPALMRIAFPPPLRLAASAHRRASCEPVRGHNPLPTSDASALRSPENRTEAIRRPVMARPSP